jgi:O-antigen ligase
MDRYVSHADTMFENPVSSDSLISGCLVALIAFALAAYWPVYAWNAGASVLVLRPPIVGAAILLAFIWRRKPAGKTETTLIVLFSVQLALLLVPTLLATQPEAARTDWFKLVLMSAICVAVARALRDDLTARWFGWCMLAVSFAMSLYMLGVYFQVMGARIPTYESLREFKGALILSVPLNNISMEAVLCYLGAACLIRAKKSLVAVGIPVFFVAGLMTGSRTPLVISLAALLAVLLVGALRSPKFNTRFTAWIVAACLMLGLALALVNATFRDMSHVTEGRWDLWYVAWQKFTEQPIFGYGFESWHDDLASRVPGVYAMTFGSAGIEHLTAGSYHNVYLTMLAEQGLVGSIPTLAIFWFLLSKSYGLAFWEWATWRKGRWALFGAMVITLRSMVETTGLFGYADEPYDYCAMIFLALVVSRYSREEDGALAEEDLPGAEGLAEATPSSAFAS